MGPSSLFDPKGTNIATVAMIEEQTYLYRNRVFIFKYYC